MRSEVINWLLNGFITCSISLYIMDYAILTHLFKISSFCWIESLEFECKINRLGDFI